MTTLSDIVKGCTVAGLAGSARATVVDASWRAGDKAKQVVYRMPDGTLGPVSYTHLGDLLVQQVEEALPARDAAAALELQVREGRLRLVHQLSLIHIYIHFAIRDSWGAPRRASPARWGARLCLLGCVAWREIGRAHV